MYTALSCSFLMFQCRMLCVLLNIDAFMHCVLCVCVLITYVRSKFEYSNCRDKVEAILNQSLFHLPYQTSVTGKLTHLSWTSQIQLLLERCDFIFLAIDHDSDHGRFKVGKLCCKLHYDVEIAIYYFQLNNVVEFSKNILRIMTCFHPC